MKTIGYFGDSFCASDHHTSWCCLLAKQLQRQPIHFGQQGGSIWKTFLTIEQMQKEGTLPDTMFFCYTEPYRLYHPELQLSQGSEPLEEKHNEIYKAANLYYMHLRNHEKDDLAYRYALQWFDREVLKPLAREHEIIQMWSMDPADVSVSGMKIQLTTGLVINESILNFAYRYVDAGPGFKFDPTWGNHLSDKGNRDFASHIGNKIESYIKNE
jgi:hypothetical protein